MNYDLIYDQLIFKAKLRELYFPLKGYSENHHIIPKCIDPSLENLRKHPENKAVLTPEEHYDAHVLLVQMDRYKGHPNYAGLVYGAKAMTVNSPSHDDNRRNNILYGWLKRTFSEVHSKNQTGKKLLPESIAKRESTKKLNSQKLDYVHPLNGRQSPKKGKPRKPHSKETHKKRLESYLKTVNEPSYISPKKGQPAYNKGVPSSNKGIKLSEQEKIDRGMYGPHPNRKKKNPKHSKEAKQNMKDAWAIRHIRYSFSKTATELF